MRILVCRILWCTLILCQTLKLVLIDFGHCSFRTEDMSNEEWRAKLTKTYEENSTPSMDA